MYILVIICPTCRRSDLAIISGVACANDLFDNLIRPSYVKSSRINSPDMVHPVILSVNAGSSSIKYSVYEKTSSTSVQLIASASISGFTAPPTKFNYTLFNPSSSTEIESAEAGDVDASNHEEAFKYFIDFLTTGNGRKSGEKVLDLERVSVVCHRIVHGGPEPNPLTITTEELHHLDSLSDLAPLCLQFPYN